VSEGDADEDADKRFGNNLRRLREEADMTQAELAQAMTERGWPWHQSTVARVESGRQSVRFSEAEVLAKILGVALDRLTWVGPEGPEAAAVAEAGRRLRRAFERTNNAVRLHARALDDAQQMLERHRNSPYQRVRDASAELQATIRNYGFEKAVDEGFNRYDKDRARDEQTLFPLDDG
jgi:transcriptional regulator with XRE-family HTH domain